MTASSHLRWSIWAAWLGMLGGGCSGTVADDAGVDAGVDAGRDGGQDAGPDAGRDAGIDGGWISLAVPDPTRCELSMATAERVAATSWPIEPCPDRTGCRRIVTPGGPVGTNPFRIERGHGAHDGTRGLFTVLGEFSGNRDVFVVDDGGHALAGFRTRALTPGGTCTQTEHDVSATHLAFVLLRTIEPDGIAEFFYRGELVAVPSYVADLRAPFAHGGSQELRLDGVRTAAWMSFQSVVAVEADGTESVIAPALGGGCEVADVVADAVFVECSLPTNVHVQLPGGPLRALFASGVNFGLDSDGTDMAWIRFEPLDGGFQPQVWASPHASDPGAVVERHVADVPGGTNPQPTDLRVGFGYAALLEQSDRLGVYRLSDGARAEILAPAGEYWSGFVQYIGPEEIAATSGVPSTSPPTDSQLMFIRIDSLTFVPP